MKLKLIHLTSAALFSFACTTEIQLEPVQLATQDTVDSLQGIGANSLELFAELEASSAVFEAIPDANLFASLIAGSLSQTSCITATATNEVVDVTYACGDATFPIEGSSQIVVTFDDVTSLITFTSHAENFLVNGKASTIDNVFEIQDLNPEGTLTHSSTASLGEVALSRSAKLSVKLSEDRSRVLLNNFSNIKVLIQKDGVDSLEEDFSELALDKVQGLPVSGSVQPVDDAFPELPGGIVCAFLQDLDGNIIVNSRNAVGIGGLEDFDFSFQVDAAGSLIPILED